MLNMIIVLFFDKKVDTAGYIKYFSGSCIFLSLPRIIKKIGCYEEIYFIAISIVFYIL